MLSVDGLVKRYSSSRRGAEAVLGARGVSFRVEAGEFFTIVGPSGCGKTTTLRCIAGLERPDEGEIELDSIVLHSSRRGVSVPANQRGLGMVFQSYAVWPHMDVFTNVAFPLTVAPRKQRLGRAQVRQRVERALSAVRLEELANRPATDLSSGQQQRIALARALVTEPPLLLLDEPLSNIDAKLREEMRSELVRLQRELGVTTVYVTHDQAEALALSDSVAVMRDGAVEQVGSPREVYDRPSSLFVADFIGSSNLLAGTVIECSSVGVRVMTAAGPVSAPDEGHRVGQAVVLAVRPERIELVRKDEAGPPLPGDSAWVGDVRSCSFLGDSADHVVGVGPAELRVRTDARCGFAAGTEVLVHLPEHECVVFAAP